MRAILQYGLAYSVTIWIWQLRGLVNPLIVGRYAGAEAMGVIALAIRLVESLSFAKRIAWRISIAALARIQNDRHRMAAAITEGMRLQVLVLAPVLLGFSLVSPWLVEALFGARWLLVIDIYPFIALSYLANACFWPPPPGKLWPIICAACAGS